MARKSAASQMKDHENTYRGFLNLTKLSIVALGVTMIALYFMIVAVQPLIGWAVLLIVMPACVVFVAMSGGKSQPH